MIFALTILPPILIAYLIYKADKYDVEPTRLIIKSFLFGFFITIPAVILEIICKEGQPSDYDNPVNLFIYTMIGIALVEEGLKFFFLKRYLFSKPAFNEPLDGIVYSVMISMGFALIENIGYVYGAQQEDRFGIAVLRMLTAIPLHAVCGVIMGYYVGMAKFNGNTVQLAAKGLGLAVLIHGVYDYFLLLGHGVLLSFLALVIAIYYAKKAIRIHQLDSKKRNSFR